MSDLDKLRSEFLQDPEFREYYMDMQPSADISKAIIGARIEKNMTQKELSQLSGVPQADISRLESCKLVNPKLSSLKRIAKAFNLRVKIEFVPFDESEMEEKQ